MELLTPEGPAVAPGETSWEAMALLSVLLVVVQALSPGKRRVLVRSLELIAADWERHAAELPAGRVAAARFIRPALAMLRAQFGIERG